MGTTTRVGVGVDVHAFADEDGRELWLGGVRWPGETPLAGHSDADVISHAACNAILSAAGLGDLGSTFGVGRPEWAGASGTRLLAEAARLVRQAGFDIEHVAVQVVSSRPKVSPRRTEMETVLAATVGASVSVSAATTDGLGFVGRGEGAVGLATAVLTSAARNGPARRRRAYAAHSPMTTTLQRRARERLRSKSTK